MMAPPLRTPFDFVLMLGDNLYGREAPEDIGRNSSSLQSAFGLQRPFYAALGNHDNAQQTAYRLQHGGKEILRFQQRQRPLLALDSTKMTPEQLDWIGPDLNRPGEWKICFFHHPLLLRRRHGPDSSCRSGAVIIKHGVDICFRVTTNLRARQASNDIQYFVSGAGGQLRRGNIRPRPTACGFDQTGIS